MGFVRTLSCLASYLLKVFLKHSSKVSQNSRTSSSNSFGKGEKTNVLLELFTVSHMMISLHTDREDASGRKNLVVALVKRFVNSFIGNLAKFLARTGGALAES
jgi:hypothetical protein